MYFSGSRAVNSDWSMVGMMGASNLAGEICSFPEKPCKMIFRPLLLGVKWITTRSVEALILHKMFQNVPQES